MSRLVGRNWICWWLLPAIALQLGIIALPLARTLALTGFELDQFGAAQRWTGLANIKSLLRDAVFTDLVVPQTLTWTMACVGVTLVASLWLAGLLQAQQKGRAVSRSLVLLPWGVALSLSAIVWRWILQPDYGSLGQSLRAAGWLGGPLTWLAVPGPALAAVIGVGIWASIPFTTLTLAAGLEAVPAELYEAASLDGAGGWRQYFSIGLPLVQPVLLLVVLLNVIYVFNSFAIIWTLTRGEPANRTDTVITYLYAHAFEYHDFQAAAAMSLLTFLALLGFSILYAKIMLALNRAPSP